MPNTIQINRLTNANVYVDGNSLLGRAMEINLPDIKAKMSDHQALGLQGMIELPSGIDKLEAKIKWNSLYPEVLRKTGNPYKAVKMMVKASIENYEGGDLVGRQAVTTYLTGQFKQIPLGSFKQNDNVELESGIAVTYIKQEIAGEVVLEFDAMANILKVNGVDILAEYRANLGIQ